VLVCCRVNCHARVVPHAQTWLLELYGDGGCHFTHEELMEETNFISVLLAWNGAITSPLPLDLVLALVGAEETDGIADGIADVYAQAEFLLRSTMVANCPTYDDRRKLAVKVHAAVRHGDPNAGRCTATEVLLTPPSAAENGETASAATLNGRQKYQQLEQLGVGTYGVVFKAKAVRSGNIVALKVGTTKCDLMISDRARRFGAGRQK
jgi:hypothetical protein